MENSVAPKLKGNEPATMEADTTPVNLKSTSVNGQPLNYLDESPQKDSNLFSVNNKNLSQPSLIQNSGLTTHNSKETSAPTLAPSRKDRRLNNLSVNTAELLQKKPSSSESDNNDNEASSEVSTPSSQDEDFINIGQSDPRKWSRTKKNFILFIVAAAGIIGPIASTILYPAIPVIKDDLHTSAVLANGLVSVYIFFKGAAPLVWASYSDAYGTRRKIYLVSFTLFIITSVICGFSWNIWTLMLMRGLQSCGSSAVQSIGAGTISDIYDSYERGSSYGIFYVGPLVGPLLGPIIGGYVTQYLGWRWIFWMLTLFGTILLAFIFFALPETFRPQKRPHTLLRQPTVPDSPKRFNPFSSLELLKYPWVSLIQVYICAVFAIIFAQNTLVPRSFEKLYNLSTAEVGLVFLAPSAGYMLGSVIGGRYSDFVLAKYKTRNGGISYPEMRLNSSWLGAVLIPISFFVYGWFVEFKLPLYLPLIAMFLGGFSTYLAFNSTSTYLVDAFPGRSASAIAVSNFLRGISAAISSLISIPLEDALGVGWTYTLLVGITVLSTSCLIWVYCRGRKWREAEDSNFSYQALNGDA
ncbi:18549_t:CDS:2 [Acaulospora morrowiae]|uniref:18549_t:CDS:1 n=1 Tax=Acaulospora morrowiae TaxID=94023 RepID=A0A9N9C5F1_9GLOM|nr:18549_t:CDS:2 [Acaulospora morrowiae]